VAEHLARCEECTGKLTQVCQAQALLHSVQEDAPLVRWPETDERIQTAAATRLARMERKPLWPWAIAAVGVMAAVLAFVVLRPATPRPQPTAPVAVQQPPSAPVVSAPHEDPVAPTVPSPPPTVIATRVESASGAWIREADAPERSLQAGTELRTGAFVRTRAKSSAVLQLPDASRVRLSSDSEVTLARTETKDVQLTVTKGRLTVQASHVARQGFTVEAAGVRASVVGTVFSVERTERGAVVAVLEGKVRVETEGQPPRFVGAGERLEVRTGQPAHKAQPLSAKDRLAFQDLKQPPAESTPPARPTPEKTPASTAAGKPSDTEATGSETAPSPVPTSPEPVEAVVTTPSTSAPGAQSSGQDGATWSPPEPGTADARFLWSAREQLDAKTCESFLVGLAEIADHSRVREFREQARYLRARCFAERLAKAEEEAEYRRYLQEFPKGRYVREAKAALLP
jgi:ferric-dicitrate binding protein FerR (iron transport regulator)